MSVVTTPTGPTEVKSSTATLKEDLLALMSGRISVVILGFVLQIINRRLLGPTLVGVWNYIEIIRDQLNSFSLGVAASAERQMPILRGQGRLRDEEELRSLTLTYLVVEGVIVGVAYLPYWYVTRHNTADLRIGMALIPLLLVIARVLWFYRLILPNMKAFRTFAWTSTALYVINFLMPLYILVGGLYGVFIGLIANGLLSIGLYWISMRARLPLHWYFSPRKIAQLLPIGMPLALFGFMSTLMERLDALMVSAFMGTTSLGLYYFGPQLATSISNLPKIVAHVAYPNFLESYGRNGPQALLPQANRYMRLSMYVMVPVIVSGAYFSTEFVVRILLPGFTPGLGAIQVSILTVVFWQIDFLATQILLVCGRVWALIAITTTATALLGGLIGMVLSNQPSLTAVAWAVVVTRLLEAVTMALTAYRTISSSAQDQRRELGGLILTGCLWIALIVGIDELVPTPVVGPTIMALAASVAVREGLFILGMLTFLVVFQRPILRTCWVQILHTA
ncbi:MAG: lipopolysaccharide biosynthesis protein [Deltaproteobacteria bacterium]|nr:lipopolysaccharide biosynthesis protein [Deltaproteobacteria bacterium]